MADSDLELIDLEVKFERGPAWHPTLRHLPGGGNAKVQVWAK